jgi:hypothetical protein
LFRLNGSQLQFLGSNENNTTNAGPIGGTVVVDTWQHAAATRKSGILRVFLNGTLLASSDTTGVINSIGGAATVRVGAEGSDGGNPFTGHIDQVEIIKGRALWDGDFTPPIAPSITVG